MCAKVTLDDFCQWRQGDNILKFELVAIVLHIGQSADSGHYVTVVRESSKWLCLDDAKVSIQMATYVVSCYALQTPVYQFISDKFKKVVIMTDFLCKSVD